jgi:hypothetical protein
MRIGIICSSGQVVDLLKRVEQDGPEHYGSNDFHGDSPCPCDSGTVRSVAMTGCKEASLIGLHDEFRRGVRHAQ